MHFLYRYLTIIVLLYFSTTNLCGIKINEQPIYHTPTTIVAETLDELVIKGIQHIKENGERFKAHAGNGQQAYDVSYTLLNPKKRLHYLRNPISIKYFCKELLAYFRGSLNVHEGLAQASSIWLSLADKNGRIASNYGYYIFHQKVPSNNTTQYEWVVRTLEKNLESRKAFININQPHHKIEEGKDFPCTIGIQFFIKDNHLCCVVSSRSTDIYTGLPYDMGFFAFVTELIYIDLKTRLAPEKAKNLKLGYVTIKTNFTQIYDKTRHRALSLLEKVAQNAITTYTNTMPLIENAQETLQDIYQQTAKTNIMQWIYKNAELPLPQ